MGRYDEVLTALAPEPPPDPKFADLRASRRMEQAWVASRRGENAKAETLLDDAEREAHGANSLAPRLLSEIAIRKTYVFGEQHKFDAARNLINGVNWSDEEIGKDQIRFAYGYILMRDAQFEEAARQFEAALPGYESRGNANRLARLLNNLGGTYYHLGDFDLALGYLHRAEPLLQKGSDLTGQRICFNTIGLIHLNRNEYAASADYLNRALALARKMREENSEAEVLNNLALTAIGTEDWKLAEDFNRRALEIKRRHDDREGETYSLGNEARIAQGRREFDRAIQILDAICAGKQVNPALRIDAEEQYISVYRQLKKEKEARMHYQAALSLVDRVRAEMVKDENKLAWYASQNSLHQEWVRFLLEMNRPDEALEAVEASRGRLMLDRSGNRQRGLPPSRESAYRRFARRHHAVLLSYWLTPELSYVWVITPEKILLCHLPGEATISSLVSAYQSFIEEVSDPLHSENSFGEHLTQVILDPVLPLIGRARRVILVPDGPLHILNFETLPVRGHYWIRDVTLSVTPSLNVLTNASPRTSPRSKGNEEVLAIGDADATPGFPRLRNAATELRSVARFFPHSLILQGGAATPAAFLNASGSPVYIHFAAHAAANAERPLESAVILSPEREPRTSSDARAPFSRNYGRLTAGDILRKRVPAELVTISACSSAGIRSYHGEGLVGFAWAFLQSGAHGVIAGLWDASDDSTAHLMTGLYSRLAHGTAPADALRDAKLELVDGNSHFARPYYWAAFQYYRGAGD